MFLFQVNATATKKDEVQGQINACISYMEKAMPYLNKFKERLSSNKSEFFGSDQKYGDWEKRISTAQELIKILEGKLGKISSANLDEKTRKEMTAMLPQLVAAAKELFMLAAKYSDKNVFWSTEKTVNGRIVDTENAVLKVSAQVKLVEDKKQKGTPQKKEDGKQQEPEKKKEGEKKAAPPAKEKEKSQAKGGNEKAEEKKAAGQGAIKKSDYEFWYEVGFGSDDKDSAKWKENYTWAQGVVKTWKADEKKMPALLKGMDEKLLSSLVAYAKSMEGDFLDLTVGSKQAQTYLGKSIEIMKANKWLAADWTPEKGFSKEEATVLLTLIPLVYRNRADDLVKKTAGKLVAEVAKYIYDADTKKSQFATDSFLGARNIYIKQSELNTKRAEKIAEIVKPQAAPASSAATQVQDSYEKLDDFVKDPAVRAAMDVLGIAKKNNAWDPADFAAYQADGKYDVNAILEAAKNKPAQAVASPEAAAQAQNVSRIAAFMTGGGEEVSKLLGKDGLNLLDADGKISEGAPGMAHLGAISAMKPRKQRKALESLNDAIANNKQDNQYVTMLLEGKMQEDLEKLGITKASLDSKANRTTEESNILNWFNKKATLEAVEKRLSRQGKTQDEVQTQLKTTSDTLNSAFLASVPAYAKAAADAKTAAVEQESSFATLGELLRYDTYPPATATTQNLLDNIRHSTAPQRTLDERNALYDRLANEGKDATTGKYTQDSVKKALDAINAPPATRQGQGTGAPDVTVAGPVAAQPPVQDATYATGVPSEGQVAWVKALFMKQDAVDYFNKIPNVDVQVAAKDNAGKDITVAVNARALVLESIRQASISDDVMQYTGKSMALKEVFEILYKDKGGKVLLEDVCQQRGITVPQ